MGIERLDTFLTDEQIRRYTEAGYWGDTTFADLLRRNAGERPDQEAFLDDRRRTTWAELWEQSRRLAAALARRGIGRGDVVAVQLPNRIEFVQILAAVGHLGAVLCQYPPDYRAREVEFILDYSGAVAVVVARSFRDFDYLEMTDAMRGGLPGLSLTLLVDDDEAVAVPDGWQRVADLREEAAAPAELEALDENAPRADEVMRMAFTSGTTGEPKAVLHTHNTTLFTNRNQNIEWGIDEHTRFLQFLPIGLNAGLFTLIQTALAGCTTVLMERFDSERALELVERERITTFLTAPTGLIALVNSKGLSRRDVSSLELIETGGASTPVEVLREANARLGCPVVDVYGMLEAGWISCTPQGEPVEDWVGTVGRPYPWFEFRLLDDDGAEVADGEQGEVAITGPTICVGYYANPEQNRASRTADGWFLTGDLATRTADGSLRITGRKKDMIIHGGANIWPREIEEALFADPRILSAAVIGVPDEYFGENVCACIVPRPGVTMDFDDVIESLSGQIAKYKLPQRVEFMSEMPIGPTGKVQKRALRDAILA